MDYRNSINLFRSKIRSCFRNFAKSGIHGISDHQFLCSFYSEGRPITYKTVGTQMLSTLCGGSLHCKAPQSEAAGALPMGEQDQCALTGAGAAAQTHTELRALDILGRNHRWKWDDKNPEGQGPVTSRDRTRCHSKIRCSYGEQMWPLFPNYIIHGQTGFKCKSFCWMMCKFRLSGATS